LEEVELRASQTKESMAAELEQLRKVQRMYQKKFGSMEATIADMRQEAERQQSRHHAREATLQQQVEDLMANPQTYIYMSLRFLARVSPSVVRNPQIGLSWARAYSRSSLHRASDSLGGWYGQQARATTILTVRKENKVCIVGDGQVTLGSQVIKPNARKVRKLKEGVICGFAGATADAMTLFERLESKLQEHPETMRACVEMAKAWRMDKYLRRLEAIMIVCDANVSLTLTGTGDVIEPEDGIIGIGSGGAFATAAARALKDVDGMDAESICTKAMTIAADMCVYTNHNFIIQNIDATPVAPSAEETTT